MVDRAHALSYVLSPLQGLLIYSVIDFIDPNDFHGSFPL